jgi:hypothetical protein
MRFLISLAVLALSSQHSAAKPVLEGEFSSACEWSGIDENSVIASKTFWAFSDGKAQIRQVYFDDSNCLHEVKSEFSWIKTCRMETLEVFDSVKYPRGFPYRFKMDQCDDGEEFEGCYYLDPQGFSDKKALYLGYTEMVDGKISCELALDEILAQ